MNQPQVTEAVFSTILSFDRKVENSDSKYLSIAKQTLTTSHNRKYNTYIRKISARLQDDEEERRPLIITIQVKREKNVSCVTSTTA